jgi:NAD(P)-dependent dehydrogenase (short-subunit alcohol dehydrogenase family)
MGLSGRVAVITGGTGNLGRLVAERVLDEGAMVAVPWRTEQKWRDFEAGLPERQRERCLGVRADLTDEDQVARLMRSARERFGALDILLNLAGAYSFGRRLWETDAAAWDRMMALNLRTAFLCAKHAVPAMLEAGRGRIVNVSSKACEDLQPGAGAYAVAKAGLITLTRALRQELKGTGVTANVIMPSIIDTPETRGLMPDGDADRWVKPEQIADALVALCSEECDAVSGSVLRLFGGL